MEPGAASLLNLGRRALDQRKLDQALLLLSTAVLKAPHETEAWFALAGACARKGRHDAASICFHQAKTLAEAQDSPMAQRVRVAAHQNMWLSSEKTLQRHWLPMHNDALYVGPWRTALRDLADALLRLQAGEGGKGGMAAGTVHAWVQGGLGWHAATLAGLVQQLRALQPLAQRVGEAGDDEKGTAGQGEQQGGGRAAPLVEGIPTTAAAAAVAEAQPRPVICVQSVHGDRLSLFLAGQAIRASCARAAACGSSDLAAAGVELASVLASETIRGRLSNGGAVGGGSEEDEGGVSRDDAGEDSVVLRLLEEVCKLAERTTSLDAVEPGNASNSSSRGAGAGAAVGLLVCVDACSARLSLQQLASQLWQAKPNLLSQALLCPVSVSVWGVLVESSGLVDMNEVNLAAMEEDTGLDYSAVNELLWKHWRPLQVDRFPLRTLSPRHKLTTVSMQQLLHSPHKLLRQSSSAEFLVTSAGRLDCVVVWLEYELCPGTVLSYAPHGVQVDGRQAPAGKRAPPVLTPHAWQHVHYIPSRPQVAPGQHVAVDWRLDHGDVLRLELDESLSPLDLRPSRARPGGLDADQGSPASPAGPEELPSRFSGAGQGQGVVQAEAAGLDVTSHSQLQSIVGGSWFPVSDSDGDVSDGLPGLRDRSRDMTDVSWRPQQQREREGAAQQQGLERYPEALGAGERGGGATGLDVGEAEGRAMAGKSEEFGNADSSSSSSEEEADGGPTTQLATLPYHIRMLNDRDRTVRYRDGIHGAVRAMLAKSGRMGDGRALLPLEPTGSPMSGVLLAPSCAAAAELPGPEATGQGTTAPHVPSSTGLADLPVRDLQPDAATTPPRPPPPFVLDVGAGTGLLSVLAARAGAPAVAAVERELPLVLAASALVHGSGVGGAVSVWHTTTGQMGTGKEEAGAEEEKGLPRRAALVVHEVFGTDPLSEQILTTMRHVRERLAEPDALYLPSGFRVVAALAAGGALTAAFRNLPSPHLPTSHSAGQEAPSALAPDLSPLLAWRPWKVEVDVTEVPGLVLLSEPAHVLVFDLCAPVAMSGEGEAEVSLCAPTPILEYAETGRCRASAAELGSEASGPPADCIISWFAADCGEGGWLSSGPSRCKRTHWGQNVHFLAGVAPGLELEGGVARGSGVVKLRAQYMVDRVLLSATVL